MPIAVPFLTGNRQFSIELAEPVVLLRGPPSNPTTHVLRGEVELLLSKPMSACQVLVKLIGKSNMLWPEGLGPRGSKVYHEKTILDQNLILDSRPDNNQIFQAGLQRWPFEFLIPNRMVETIEDEMAQVYYYVAATVQRPGMTSNLRCRRDILLLRTLYPTDDALTTHSLPTTSIVAERRTEACDATIYVEKSIVSSGTQFPISIVLTTHTKKVSLESMSMTLTEKRTYQVPEYNARRAELHDFKLQLASVNNLADAEQMRQAMIHASDIPTNDIRRALSGKNAHIPLGSTPFQYKFMFTLPNCLTMNHTTYFKEMNFLHHLKIDIELSVPLTESRPSSPGEGSERTTTKETERTHIHLETPIAILDCRLKEDFTTLPTYQESMSDTTVDQDNMEEEVLKKRSGFFICPCYVDYKKKSSKFNNREKMMLRQNNGSDSSSSEQGEPSISGPPPPPYEDDAKELL